MRIDPILELDGLYALARSLVQGDADADDLLQDAAVAMLEHPPSLDRPVRPWLATVIVNRWRMNRRSENRRRARELAVEVPVPDKIDPFERAQTMRRLGNAVAALRDPYRQVVMARYFDGKTSIEIASELGIPPVTVRTRLLRALEMLRTSLDEAAPRKRWQQLLLVPQAGWFATAKAQVAFVLLLFLLIAGGAWLVWPRERAQQASAATQPALVRAMSRTPVPELAQPPSLDARATVEPGGPAEGLAAGRVLDSATGEGVAGATLVFAGAGGSIPVTSRDDGAFELAPEHAGEYALAQISASGYLPYTPALPSSGVHVRLARDVAIRGLVVLVAPARDYRGRVVDHDGTPVAGATVTLVGTAPGERALEAAWTSDRDGRFTFHAEDHAVLEASAADRLGWGSVDVGVTITKQLQIVVDRVPARDATIAGRVVDEAGRPLADVIVRAYPEHDKPDMAADERKGPLRPPVFATSVADGTFELHGLDHDTYNLSSDVEDRAPRMVMSVAAGSKGVEIELSSGLGLAGTVATADGAPVPAFTLLVLRRVGAARELVLSRSVVDAHGHFAVRVEPGAYELIASAPGWAPNAPRPATAPGVDTRLVVSTGATLRGTIVSAANGAPLAHARIARDGMTAGASVQPANPGTLTRADGTFELRGVPPGAMSVIASGDGFDQKIESGLVAAEGEELGPVSIALSPIAPGGALKTQYVGVGITTKTEGDDLVVETIVPGAGADLAGMQVGDRIFSVDGVSVSDVGDASMVSRIRGLPNTRVTFGIRRGDRVLTLVATRTQLQT